MKIGMQEGQRVIDAEDLGAFLNIAPSAVQEAMRTGDITSRYETGEGDDTGRFRLTFLHAGRRVQLTCAEDGRVIGTVRMKMERG